MQKQFAQRRTKKTYLAVVDGRPKLDAAIIDMPIERNPKAPATFRVGANGKPAKTTYRLLRYDETTDRSLLELKPETGRTHQLRVHLKHIGTPIVGDALYGTSSAARMMLHASELELTLPDSERMTFVAPTSQEFGA